MNPADIVDEAAGQKSGNDPKFVREAFSGIASRYVLANHTLSLGIDVLWRKKTAALVASFRPSRVLDLATGSGDLARAILAACPAAKVLGADFSVPMMREARGRKFFHLIAADAMCLPLADGSFDAATVAFGLRNMASWPEALREMRRVLRPGGHLVILDFSLPASPLIRRLHLFYLRLVMPRIAGALTGKAEAYRYLCGSIEKFPSGEGMKSLLRDAGFADPQAEPLTLGIASLYSAKKE